MMASPSRLPSQVPKAEFGEHLGPGRYLARVRGLYSYKRTRARDGCLYVRFTADLVDGEYASAQVLAAGGQEVPSALSEDDAPSASLDHPKARPSPSHPGVPSQPPAGSTTPRKRAPERRH